MDLVRKTDLTIGYLCQIVDNVKGRSAVFYLCSMRVGSYKYCCLQELQLALMHECLLGNLSRWLIMGHCYHF